MLYNEELKNLYSSPNDIRVTKARGMKCVWHVACMGELRNADKI
jgi:hypothetical protein